MKRISMVTLGFVVALVIGAVGSSTPVASAACARVKVGEPSPWDHKHGFFTSECLTLLVPVGVSAFIEIESKGETVEAGVFCDKVKAGEPSSWENSKCSVEAKGSTGKFVEVIEELEPQACKAEKNGRITLCVETPTGSGLLLVSGEVKFSGTKEVGSKAVLSAEGGPTIACEAARDEGFFAGEESLKVTNLVVTFSTNCQVTNEEAACETKEPITTAPLGGSFSSTTDVTFTPSSGTTFALITIKSRAGKTCLFAGTGSVVGSQLCELSQPETDAVIKLIVCLPAGSKLKIFGIPATLELTENVSLEESLIGDAWDVIEGT